MLEIPAQTASRRESNRLLRAIWAQIRSEFGKCAWQYTPRKEGASRFISFGYADIGEATVGVGVTYAQRDCISRLHFTCGAAQLRGRLRACVTRAIESAPAPKSSWLAREGVLCPAQLPFAPRRYSTYALEPAEAGRSRVLIRVESYDSVDAQSQAKRRFANLLDLLAVVSNCILAPPSELGLSFPMQIKTEVNDSEGNALNSATVQAAMGPTPPATDPDWYDGIPTMGSLVAPCDEDLDAIDRLLPDDEESEGDLLLAAAHFRAALETEHRSSMSSMQGLGGSHELSLTLYLSALEVISENNAEPAVPCESCGQPIYAISQRVSNYALQHEGEPVANVIKRMYGRRSKYLHRGILFSTRSYVGTTLPQLDSSDETGCLHAIPLVPLVNVREWTSHMLRRELRAHAATHSPPG